MSTWPPLLTEPQEQALLSLASDYSLSHGLVLRPPASPSSPTSSSSPSTTTSIHAPYSLYPTPFPRKAFQNAKELQPLYNALYAHVAVDDEFLREVVGGAVTKVDEFQRGLYEIWEKVKKEGVKQPLQLGLFRSDYLLHQPDPKTPYEDLEIKQVEFNTISSSFGPLATKVTELHRYLMKSGAYPNDLKELKLDAMPINDALKSLAKGLAEGHKAYGNDQARILMVVQDNERNAFDQRALEWELLETHSITLLRLPFSTLHTHLSLSPNSSLFLTHPTLFSSPIEISLIYYRAGYTPVDYPTSNQWETRLMIERSKAIKCPSVGLQLAGSKKVQQVLDDPVVLSRFLGKGKGGGDGVKAKLSSEDAKKLLGSFSSLYPLDDSERGREALKLAYEIPEKFVLKPQREGGGNNIYRKDIPPYLDSLDLLDEEKKKKGEGKDGDEFVREREGYVLMDLIQVPLNRQSIMVRAGEEKGVRGEVVSELGIYGVVLFRDGPGGEGGAELLVNEEAGMLLRTKGVESDEGGVAVGFSVIDSVLLV